MKEIDRIFRSWITSLILGIIGAAIPCIVGTIYDNRGSGPIYREIIWSVIASGVLILFGLFLGIRGQKKTGNKLFIISIIICVLSMLFWLYVFGTWIIFVYF
jgi:hypothetical protein